MRLVRIYSSKVAASTEFPRSSSTSNLIPEPTIMEASFVPKPTDGLSSSLAAFRRISQHFVFQAPAMALRAALKAKLDPFFEITDQELCHRSDP